MKCVRAFTSTGAGVRVGWRFTARLCVLGGGCCWAGPPPRGFFAECPGSNFLIKSSLFCHRKRKVRSESGGIPLFTGKGNAKCDPSKERTGIPDKSLFLREKSEANSDRASSETLIAPTLDRRPHWRFICQTPSRRMAKHWGCSGCAARIPMPPWKERHFASSEVLIGRGEDRTNV